MIKWKLYPIWLNLIPLPFSISFFLNWLAYWTHSTLSWTRLTPSWTPPTPSWTPSTPSWTHSTPSWTHSTPSWTQSTIVSLTSSSLTSKTPMSCSTIYGQAGTQTTATRRTGYRRTARLFNIYHLLPLDATTYKVFLCHCIIELVSSRLQNWIDMFLWLFIRLLLELIRLLLELLWLLLELILLDLLWHQKILYLVAPFMGKQVLKRRSSNGSAVGPPGQSIYTICSPLMLQHIKFSSVIASLNWLVPSRLQNWIDMFLWLYLLWHQKL